jgi:hypothetical protein
MNKQFRKPNTNLEIYQNYLNTILFSLEKIVKDNKILSEK